MFVLPYAVDVPMRRWPTANFVLIGVNLVISLALFANDAMAPYAILHFPGQEAMPGSIFGPGRPALPPAGAIAWVGHMFAHGGWMHLFGNMLFLWTFGNAVNAKIGHGPYVALYLIGGFCAAAAQTLFSASPMLGASGAINAVVGAYLLLYPLNHVMCAFVVFLFFIFRFWRFRVPGWVPIACWFAFDIVGALGGEGNTAYFAHLGGFAFGAAALAWALWKGKVEMTAGECSLLQATGRMPRPERWAGRPTYGRPRDGVSAPRGVAIPPVRAAEAPLPLDDDDGFVEFPDDEPPPRAGPGRFTDLAAMPRKPSVFNPRD